LLSEPVHVCFPTLLLSPFSKNNSNQQKKDFLSQIQFFSHIHWKSNNLFAMINDLIKALQILSMSNLENTLRTFTS